MRVRLGIGRGRDEGLREILRLGFKIFGLRHLLPYAFSGIRLRPPVQEIAPAAIRRD